MINDNIIISKFWKEDKLNSSMIRYNINNEELEYLQNRYSDFSSIKETLYRIKYNIEEKPKCPICGHNLYFIGKHDKIYSITCSKKCGAIYSQNKRKETCLKNNGVEYPIQSKHIKNKIEKTCLEKYGVKNTFCINSIYDNNIKKYGNKYLFQSNIIREKIKNTCIEKYGGPSPMYSEIIKEKIKNTCIEKYGVDNVRKNNIIKQHIVNSINKTKKKNKSFNTSEPEDETYLSLKEKYPDVIRQYRSEVYPFNCDFYIPSNDLYIECNYHWTHGKHQFNRNNKLDISILNIWKSKNTKYYNEAIKTWTIRDINKVQVAKENNINLIIFYNINQFKLWIISKE